MNYSEKYHVERALDNIAHAHINTRIDVAREALVEAYSTLAQCVESDHSYNAAYNDATSMLSTALMSVNNVYTQQRISKAIDETVNAHAES